MSAKLVITHLTHDLQANKSYVSFVWSDDPSKRLGLELPFGTPLETVETEAQKAVLELSSELGSAVLERP